MSEDRSKPPQDAVLRRWPRTAQVAFAARCARRVQPLFGQACPTGPGEHVDGVERAIALAEEFGFDQASVFSHAASRAADAAHAADSAAFADADAASANDDDINAAAYVRASRAARAARAAVLATGGATGAAAEAAFAAARVADDVDFSEAINRAMWRDVDLLHAGLGRDDWAREAWPTEHGPSVPPEFFGPLWPEGAPEGWPEPGLPKPFRMVIDPGDADAADIEELLDAMSELHEVHTGHPLVYSEEGCYAHVPQEAI